MNNQAKTVGIIALLLLIAAVVTLCSGCAGTTATIRFNPDGSAKGSFITSAK